MKFNVDRVPYGTTLNQLTVPEKLRLRYPFHSEYDTDLRFMTNLYGGQGITPSTVTMFTGWPGSGKSTLLMQMAHAMHEHPDCFVLFNGGEESLYQTKMVTERLFKRKSPTFYVGQDSLVCGKNTGMHLKNIMAVKAGKKGSILGHMRTLIQKHPNKQPVLLIDSLQSMDDGKYADGYTNGPSAYRALKLVNDFCKETFTTAIVVGQVNKDGEAAGANKLIHTTDVWIHMRIDVKDKSETQGMRIITTRKNRYGFSGQAHVLNIWDDGLKEEGEFLTDS